MIRNLPSWTDAKRERLRVLWTAGMPTTEIAVALDVPRNSVPGAAKRLGLPGRGSPIVTRETLDHFAEALANSDGDVDAVAVSCGMSIAAGRGAFARMRRDLGGQAR